MICYVIIPAGSITNAMINVSAQTSSDTLRYNDVQSKAVFKFENDVANSHLAIELFQSYLWYSHDEILTELEKTEWL